MVTEIARGGQREESQKRHSTQSRGAVRCERKRGKTESGDDGLTALMSLPSAPTQTCAKTKTEAASFGKSGWRWW